MSRSRWPVILYCLLSWAGAFYHLILFSFLRRDVQKALDLSDVALGWIDGLTFAAAALGGLVLGRLADRGGRRLVLALAPGVPALGAWLLSSAEGATAAIVARIVVGFGVGGGWGVGHAVIADLYDGTKRLRAAAILQTGGPVGVIAAALVGCVLIPGAPDGWRQVLAWSALTALIPLLDPPAFGPPAFGPPALGPPALAGSSSADPAALRIFLLLVLQMTAYWCTFAWLPTHLMSQGATRRTVGWMQMATGGAQGLADLGFGWASPKVGLHRLFRFCNVAFGLGVLALFAAFPSVAASPLALTATICAVGLGSGSWAAFGPLYAEYVAPEVRSSVSSLSYHLARASQLVVQPAVAALGAGGSSHGAALIVGALAAWAGAVAIGGLRGSKADVPAPPEPTRI